MDEYSHMDIDNEFENFEVPPEIADAFEEAPASFMSKLDDFITQHKLQLVLIMTIAILVIAFLGLVCVMFEIRACQLHSRDSLMETGIFELHQI